MSEIELTSWDIEQLQRLIHGNKNAGKIVQTNSGLKGRTYNKESLVNGKICVYCENGTKLLCDPNSLKVTGFID